MIDSAESVGLVLLDRIRILARRGIQSRRGLSGDKRPTVLDTHDVSVILEIGHVNSV